LSLALFIWRYFVLGFLSEVPENPQHWIFVAGTTLLVTGAVIEGYYGGRLHHR